MDPLLFGVLIFACALALLGLFFGHGAWCASREAARGAAELAQVHQLRQAAETLAADRLVQLEQQLAREQLRAQADARAEERAAEREALRAGAGSDADLADRLLDARDPPGGAPSAAPAAGA